MLSTAGFCVLFRVKQGTEEGLGRPVRMEKGDISTGNRFCSQHQGGGASQAMPDQINTALPGQGSLLVKARLAAPYHLSSNIDTFRWKPGK